MKGREREREIEEEKEERLVWRFCGILSFTTSSVHSAKPQRKGPVNVSPRPILEPEEFLSLRDDIVFEIDGIVSCGALCRGINEDCQWQITC